MLLSRAIAACIIATALVSPAIADEQTVDTLDYLEKLAEEQREGPWAIVPHSSVGLYRLNTRTGYTEFCALDGHLPKLHYTCIPLPDPFDYASPEMDALVDSVIESARTIYARQRRQGE